MTVLSDAMMTMAVVCIDVTLLAGMTLDSECSYFPFRKIFYDHNIIIASNKILALIASFSS